MSTPIADLEKEKFVLSAMLIRDGECVPEVVAALNANDFYRPVHRIVFRTIAKLYSEGTPPNALSIISELERTNELGDDKVSRAFIWSLTEYANTNAYVPSYIRDIKEKSNLRLTKEIAEKIASDVNKGIIPVSEIISTATTNLTAINASTAQPRTVGIRNFLLNDFKPYLDQKSIYANRKTGFENIDKHQILTPGVFAIGGTPASGKTTFCQQLLEQLARNGEQCVYCSYEMSVEEIFTKSIARQIFREDPYTRITASNMHYKINESTQSAIAIVDALTTVGETFEDDSRYRVIEPHGENTDELLNWLNRICDFDKPPCICIDYLQLLAAIDNPENLKIGVDNCVRKLKAFQRDTNATIFVVSSFNRTNYSQQAAYESFKESGGIEYGFDVMWALQLNIVNELKGTTNQQKIDQAKKELPRKIHLKCLKNRRGANYDCFFEYYAANDCFVPVDSFDDNEPRKTPSSDATQPSGNPDYDYEEDD